MSTDDQQAPLVHRLLAGFVGGVCRCPRLVLAAALALGAFSVYLAATRLEYQTHRDDLLDPGKECQKRWHQYLAEFGADDDMVVVVHGTDPERMKLALDDVAGRLAARPDLFDRLFYKVDLRPLRNRALLFLPAEDIQSIRDRLVPMGPLLFTGRFGWQHFTLQSLLSVEATRRVKLLKPEQPLASEDEQSFRQVAAILRSADAAVADPRAYRNPWSGVTPAGAAQEDLLAQPQYFFSGDGRLAFLLARPKQQQGSFTADRASVEGLRGLLAEVRTAYPDVEFGLTGLPVLENDEMVASRHDTELASWLALTAVVVLYLVVFRGLHYPMLTVGTLLIGISWALGWLTLTVGHLNILSATFAVMLIAMGDYGVLWVTRYEQARRGGMDVRSALLHTATHVAVGNLTAATALALAFFAAMLADFRAVAELGWIAGCGVLLCALACFTVLPAVLMLADRRGRLQIADCRLQIVRQNGTTVATSNLQSAICNLQFPEGWLPRLSARPWLVIGTALALAAGLGIFATRVHYDHNLLHLQARDLDAVKWEMTLIEHTDGASWHALSTTNTPEEALALKARYEKLPEVSRVVEIASLVPREQDRKVVLLREISTMLQRLPERGAPVPHNPPEFDNPANTVAEQMRLLRGALAALVKNVEEATGTGSSPLLAELADAARRLDERLAGMDTAVALSRLSDFERRLKGDLAEDLHRLRDVATPAPITLDDLPPALRERYVGRSGKWLLAVFAKDCLWEYGPLEHFTRQVQTVDADATGKPFGTVEGLKSLRSGFQWAGLYALGVIVLVLLADFRNLRHALIAVAPLAMGMILSLGVMGLCGLPLNPANMIALPLILGVGIDNGVHVLHDYLLRRREGHATISRAIGRGVLVKALTTMIGFGTLMVSSHRGLFGLGFVLTLGVGCCMLTALVFLPAVLRLLPAAKRPADDNGRHDERPLAA
ncbi:MAG TPA: MMPL family transporter [Gemmataceae bacterium]|nr:MMPL family transporter [Gemmataceae bacterium]